MNQADNTPERRSSFGTDEALDQALSRLPQVDLPAWAARAQALAAQRRLQRRAAGVGWIDRQEPALLIVLAATHMLWALVRVAELAAGAG